MCRESLRYPKVHSVNGVFLVVGIQQYQQFLHSSLEYFISLMSYGIAIPFLSLVSHVFLQSMMRIVNISNWKNHNAYSVSINNPYCCLNAVSSKSRYYRTGVMTRWAKCLLQKQKALSSDLMHPCESPAYRCVPFTSVLGSGEYQIQVICGAVSPTNWCTWVQRQTLSPKIRWEVSLA